MSEQTLNPAVTDVIEWILSPWPNPILHGEYNRRMFMEAVIVKGGEGAAIDRDDIQKHGALTDKEFSAIKDEYMAKGVLKEETNFCGVTLYSLQYDNKEG
jgi:hypothetical protein